MTPGESVARKTPLWVPDNSHGGGSKKNYAAVGPWGQHHGQEPIPEARLVPWSPFMAVVPSLLQWLERYAARWPYGYMARCLHGLRAT